jgi:hypothetical protein
MLVVCKFAFTGAAGGGGRDAATVQPQRSRRFRGAAHAVVVCSDGTGGVFAGPVKLESR